MNATEHPLHAIVVLAYLLALIGVGIAKVAKVRTHADFTLAGRGLSAFVLFGTLLATWIGTGSIFGNAEKTHEIGLAAWFLPLGGVLGILALIPLAPRARRFAGYTVQDILEARYAPAARVLGTLTLVCAYVTIVSYQYRAGGAVLHLLAPGLSLEQATIIAAVFVILYTALAGMISVAYTDVVNGLLMIAGFAITLPILWTRVGGHAGLAAALPAEKMRALGVVGWGEALALTLPSFLLVLGDANMYQRFFSARDPATAKRAVMWLAGGVALLEIAIILSAWMGSALTGELANPGHVLAIVASSHLPALLGAVLLATIVAVIVSTADSYLLVPATCVVRDVIQRFLRPQATERELVLASRGTVVALGLVAYGLTHLSDRFLAVALYAYTMYGAGITPALLAAFLWPRATAAGAITSIAAGIVTTILWETWGDRVLPGIATVYPALLVSVTALIGGSLLSAPRYPDGTMARTTSSASLR
jgi:SSS family solute:Na+ symporter